MGFLNNSGKPLDIGYTILLGFSGIIAVVGLIIRLMGLAEVAPDHPAEMLARVYGERIEVRGVVPDEATQTSLHALAVQGFGSNVDSGQIEVSSSVQSFRGNPVDVLQFYLEIGRNLDRSQILLRDGVVTIEGATKSAEDRDAYGNLAESRFPDLVVNNFIQVESSLQESLDSFLEGKLIEFASGSDQLLQRSWPILNEVATMIKSAGSGDVRIEVQGHTDNQGNDDANMQLSEARAESVCAYLEAQGIERSILEAKGFGETQPIADNDTAEGRQQNRRVVFVVK